jgi:hypothetical protein
MTPEELKALIESDATAAAAATAEDWVACAAQCGIIAPTIRVPVPSLDVRREASLSGVWATMVSGVTRIISGHRRRQGHLHHVHRLDRSFVNARLRSATGAGDGSGISPAAGICTQAQYDALSALGDQSQTFTALECRVAMRGA